MSPNAGGGRRVAGGVSANEYSCALGAQKNFGHLTPYLTCGLVNPTAYAYHSVLLLKGQ
jgi:hypothetical protein